MEVMRPCAETLAARAEMAKAYFILIIEEVVVIEKVAMKVVIKDVGG